ncbi:Rne/Rng family ribonuclease [Ruegeria pomeroyi]|uniref:Ribonuclease E n=1 Tax=Ruegeria pomeroyi TaxID=89184 RepID=A0A9Q3WHN7_9RHOB|nr:Rne/Rng family ribonuclease [Ruegeria pomeroyi]MCE8536109.1 Rne/Rng family ribonuclease [Ruegeria pomeroyi]
MAKKMLIDATHAEETRVVVVDGNKVEEFDFESENKRQLAGNIYLAKVTRVEPSLQAAFVDYGGNRHGFLAFSEIHPDYYQIPVADRQALMEEERAYAEAQKARDEDEEGGKPRPKPKRSRSRSRSKAESLRSSDPVETMDVTEPEISGMETIDLDEGDDRDMFEVPEGSSPMERVADTPVEEPEDVAEAATDQAAEEAEEATADAPGETPEAKAEVTEDLDDATEDDDGDDDGDDDHDVEDTPRPRRGKADAASKDDSIESIAEEDDAEDLRPVRKPRARKYKIQEVIKVRQVMLVQVVKEERGNKGAALTTYLSLAGRYCVLMPNTARGGGISRKITNAVDRKKLKEIAAEMDVPQGAGLIVRTAGAKRTKAEIKRDYEYLQRMWEQIRELTLKSIAPAKIYEEGDLIKRSIRDLYNRDIDEVLVEGEGGYRIAKDFMKMIMPSHAKNVQRYEDQLPLFARFQVESYLNSMFNPTVQLKSGGYIVIGVTEALVAIDVNSGRATKEGSIEETALKTNLEAAEEVARQLRLRDLAGLIVIDFIDMDERKNNAAVEKRLKDKLKSDRARIQVGRISGFGLLEMSRQRLRPGMIEATTQPCPSCHGTGLIRSDDNMALSILRQIEEEGTRRRSREVLVRCPVGIANYLMNQKREHIAQIEARYGLSVRIEGDAHLVSPDFSLEKFKTATRAVPQAQAPVVSVDSRLMDQVDADEAAEDEDEAEEARTEKPAENDGDGKPKRKRRRRRRRKSGGNGGEDGANDTDANDTDANDTDGNDDAGDDSASDDGEDARGAEAPAEAEPAAETESTESDEEAAPAKTPRKRTRTRKKPVKAEAAAEAASDEVVSEEASADSAAETVVAAEAEAEAAPVKKTSKPRKPSSRSKKAKTTTEPVAADALAEPVAEAEPVAANAAAAMTESPAEAETAPVEAAQVEAPAEAAKSEGEAEPVMPVEVAAGQAEVTAEEIAQPAEETPATQAEPDAEPAPELAQAEEQPKPELAVAEAEPEPDSPAKPKRRGWWSLGQ